MMIAGRGPPNPLTFKVLAFQLHRPNERCFGLESFWRAWWWHFRLLHWKPLRFATGDHSQRQDPCRWHDIHKACAGPEPLKHHFALVSVRRWTALLVKRRNEFGILEVGKVVRNLKERKLVDDIVFVIICSHCSRPWKAQGLPPLVLGAQELGRQLGSVILKRSTQKLLSNGFLNAIFENRSTHLSFV